MNCPTEGLLRARIDGELGAEESKIIDEHLQACDRCRTRWSTIEMQAQRTQQELMSLSENLDETTIDPAVAYERYRQVYTTEAPDRTLRFRHMAHGRPLWGALAACCALVLLFSIGPTRSWAQKFLAMFRVQKVAVVPVDVSLLTAESGHGRLLTQLVSDNVVVTMKPGPPKPAASPDAAGEMAGFKVKTLDALGRVSQIRVDDERAFHATLNRDRIQAVLDQAGRSDIQIPASVDGSTIAVHIPRVVLLTYGSCSSGVSQTPADSCIDFDQVLSPTISVPPSMNINALAEAGLQLGGMSAADAHAFCQTVDWSSTLIIPIPESGSSSQTFAVDGVRGTLIEVAPRGNFIGTYDLIWVKNGIVYSLHGKGSAARALSAAASLN